MLNAAFNYDPTIEYDAHPKLSIGEMNIVCQHCQALKFKRETAGMCCSSGKVDVDIIPEPPEPFLSILKNEHEDSQFFLSNVRLYNSAFQMTSFGATNIVLHDGFPSTFKIQGQVYHRIGNICPNANDQPKYLQIFFMGNKDLQLDTRCELNAQIQRHLLHEIQEMLFEHNVLIRRFKTANEIMLNNPNPEYKIVMRADRKPVGEHERCFNAPTTDEIAVIIVGNDYQPRDIVLHQRDNNLVRVNDCHPLYNALQYPLIFWNGQDGYHYDIPLIDITTHNPHPTKKVTAMQFYSFLFMIRRNSDNIILYFKELFQQLAVDVFATIENERLRYIFLNQNTLRADQYIHLQDALAIDGNVDPNDLGQIVILPSSFTNSPRYLAEYVQDSLMYVRKYGKPDLFITMTCNPNWDEITKCLKPGQQAIHRHDIIARIFRQKVILLIEVITKGNPFGPVLAFVYSIEWQKRGTYNCN